MGLLSTITGGSGKKVLAAGPLGRGIITDVELTGTTFQSGNGLVQRVCVFTVEVSLDGRAPYMATCKQRMHEIQIAQIQPGATTVAVRAGPDELTQIVLDFTAGLPVVTAAAGQGNTSAAELLATGELGRAVIVQFHRLLKRDPAGVDLYAYELTVMPDGKDPYQIQVGNPTPPAARPFLFAGSRVPVKIGTIPDAVVIDWEAAVAEDAVRKRLTRDRRWRRPPAVTAGDDRRRYEPRPPNTTTSSSRSPLSSSS
jgi:hypothetical protein